MTHPTTEQMNQEIEEFLNNPMCEPYRAELRACLDHNDATGFSQIQDRIMAEQLAMTAEEIAEVDRLAHAV